MPAESTKGVLFFARHLGTLSLAAAVLWLGVGAVSLYGRIEFHGFYWPDRMAGIARGWPSRSPCSRRPRPSSALNVRAVGGVDDAARAVALIGIVAGFLALTMAWLAPLWTSALQPRRRVDARAHVAQPSRLSRADARDDDRAPRCRRVHDRSADRELRRGRNPERPCGGDGARVRRRRARRRLLGHRCSNRSPIGEHPGRRRLM